RAASGVQDVDVRLQIRSDLAQFSLEGGDRAGARASFEQVLGEATDDATMLAVAKGLASIYNSEDEPEPLAKVLEIVARLEPDETLRAQANERLANLYEMLFDHERAIGAWERVLTSPLRAHALDALENLLQQTGAEEGLARILDLRAQDEPDARKARDIA